MVIGRDFQRHVTRHVYGPFFEVAASTEELYEYIHRPTHDALKLVHWPLMGGLLHLVQREGDWAGPQPAQAPPCCTKCNGPPINGQWTNQRIAV